MQSAAKCATWSTAALSVTVVEGSATAEVAWHKEDPRCRLSATASLTPPRIS